MAMPATDRSQYMIIQPKRTGSHPRTPDLLLSYTADDLESIFHCLADGTQPIHIDLETTGLDPTDPEGRVVGIGLASATATAGPYYVNTAFWDANYWRYFGELLGDLPLVAFNMAFDGAWLTRFLGRVPNIHGCSHVLFRMLTNEDYPGQRWNLETAQRDVLGWPETNKTELEDLLFKHGIVNQSKRPDKSRMWELSKLEPEAFGRYCALDAEASLQLWEHLMQEAERLCLPEVVSYATEEWPAMIRCLIEQQAGGIDLDQPGLAAYHTQLLADIRRAEGRLRTHPQLAKHVEDWEQEAARALYAPRLTVKRVRAKVADQPHLHPADWMFQPSDAKSRTKYEVEQGGYWYREVHFVSVPRAEAPPPKFNWESDPALRWLLWDRVFADRHEVIEDPEKGSQMQIRQESGAPILVGLTESGQKPVGKPVMGALGEVGRLLLELGRLHKLRGYIESYTAASSRDGRLHVAMRAHGTSTGRMSGGGG